ncbi:MAG: hypothetical protein ACYC21_08065 [Eubacteriales bacterium]
MKTKVLMLISLVFAFHIFNIGCISKQVTNQQYEESKPNNWTFAIFLVKNKKTSEAVQTKLEELKLENQPIITDRDLISYKWDEHMIDLQLNSKQKITNQIPLDGKPFVVIANNERIYLGALWNPLSSIPTNIPVIVVPPVGAIYKIDLGYPKIDNKDNDPRNDKRIYNSLKVAGKVR